ncbi:hypothetical protein CAOG_04466 [Capsaspora owczarzaki ATCC 30864]|uniref:Uncharacterized protein n=1 Tax=Capsaspora owczarzaki (strain ATCC 30864) TaxID=595528 RepID=A0A0D2WRB2_CAPO3|nr:hypothetical protein CAOG_04466 [Capsaspora owczarzaki ATCC 30864]KJE93713.1 hypothetical protein CAOG_004466 [Capsaspora owczarzaki ATCC 30864]|eukprot:XP_004348294.1 hypothetical protein CAOG_04466 [Capsaspora owczarzaki ATCC 30864]
MSVLRVDVLAMPVGAPIYRKVWDWPDSIAPTSLLPNANPQSQSHSQSQSQSQASQDSDRACSLILAFTQFAREICSDGLTQVHFEAPSSDGLLAHAGAAAVAAGAAASTLASSNSANGGLGAGGAGPVFTPAASGYSSPSLKPKFRGNRSRADSGSDLLLTSTTAVSASGSMANLAAGGMDLVLPSSLLSAGSGIAFVVEQNPHLLVAVFHKNIPATAAQRIAQRDATATATATAPDCNAAPMASPEHVFCRNILSAFDTQFQSVVDAVIPELTVLAKDESFGIHDVLVPTVASKFTGFDETLSRLQKSYVLRSGRGGKTSSI